MAAIHVTSSNTSSPAFEQFFTVPGTATEVLTSVAAVLPILVHPFLPTLVPIPLPGLKTWLGDDALPTIFCLLWCSSWSLLLFYIPNIVVCTLRGTPFVGTLLAPYIAEGAKAHPLATCITLLSCIIAGTSFVELEFGRRTGVKFGTRRLTPDDFEFAASTIRILPLMHIHDVVYCVCLTDHQVIAHAVALALFLLSAIFLKKPLMQMVLVFVTRNVGWWTWLHAISQVEGEIKTEQLPSEKIERGNIEEVRMFNPIWSQHLYYAVCSVVPLLYVVAGSYVWL